LGLGLFHFVRECADHFSAHVPITRLCQDGSDMRECQLCVTKSDYARSINHIASAPCYAVEAPLRAAALIWINVIGPPLCAHAACGLGRLRVQTAKNSRSTHFRVA
jgi:hypothetical protein